VSSRRRDHHDQIEHALVISRIYAVHEAKAKLSEILRTVKATCAAQVSGAPHARCISQADWKASWPSSPATELNAPSRDGSVSPRLESRASLPSIPDRTGAAAQEPRHGAHMRGDLLREPRRPSKSVFELTYQPGRRPQLVLDLISQQCQWARRGPGFE
jgi:hypothetical protein